MEGRYGYAGKILKVDLTSAQVIEIPSGNYLPKYFGGRGLAARLYWEETPPEVGALDPGNVLVFATGPLTGTGALMSSPSMCGGKSPYFYPMSSFHIATATGIWGHEMKYAGYDAFIIKGKAEKPVYLWIHDGRVEIRDASLLWGRTTRETRFDLMKVHGSRIQVACIGPAGENLVLPSIIAVDSNTAFAQGGFGAVMGSKNLKAIAVRGTGSIKVANPGKLLEMNEVLRKLTSIRNGETRTVDGKTVVGSWHPAEPAHLRWYQPNQATIDERLGVVRVRNASCPGCTTECKSKRRYADNSVPSGSAECSELSNWLAVEQEFYGVRDSKVNWEWTMLGDDLGLDTVYTGFGSSGYPRQFSELSHGRIGINGDILREANRRGILTEQNTGLPWSKMGSKEFLEKFLYMIAYRQGFGDILARGPAEYTKYIMEHDEFGPRRNEMQFLYQKVYVKAGVFGGMPRHALLKGFNSGTEGHAMNTLYTAVNMKRGKELEGCLCTQSKEWLRRFFESDKIADTSYWGDELVQAVIYNDYYAIEFDSAPVCVMNKPMGGYFSYDEVGNYLKHSMNGVPELLSAVFGEEITQEELFEMDERCVNMERANWIRDGYTRGAVDTFHDCIFEERDAKGNLVIPKEDFQNALNVYYQLRGWKAGVPTRTKLEALGLRDVADGLQAQGIALE